MRSSIFWLALTCFVVLVAGWTKEDHEIFQIRDEVELAEGAGVTFYGVATASTLLGQRLDSGTHADRCSDLLGIKPSATQEQIQKALRKKSRQEHPDKAEQNFIAKRLGAKSKDGKPKVNKRPSKAEISKAIKEAQVKYGRLTSIRDILTGPGRARYDHFLNNGFPTWRSTGYYYSRYRPGLGTTLLGLWLFTGGLVHYGVLVMGYNQKRKFVERTISKARMAAFGDDSASAGIPGMDSIGEPVSASSAMASQQAEPDEADDGQPQPRNRKERRAMEKQAAKESKVSKGPVSQKKAAAKAAAEPPKPVPKKRVVTENGKVLLVAQSGEVWIEEEDEEGNTEEFILHPDDVEKPGFKQTAVYRAPVWAFKYLKIKITGKATDEEEEEVERLGPDAAAVEIEEAVNRAANGGGDLTAAAKKSRKASKRKA